MTVYCLVELDAVSGGPAAGGSLAVADASPRALTLSRRLAAPPAQAAPPASASRPEPTVAAVVFADAASVPVADLAAYGVTDIYAVSVDGYAPQAWARAIAGLVPSNASSYADNGAICAVLAADTVSFAANDAMATARTGAGLTANNVEHLLGGRPTVGTLGHKSLFSHLF